MFSSGNPTKEVPTPPTAADSGHSTALVVLSRTSETVQSGVATRGLPMKPGGRSVIRSRRLSATVAEPSGSRVVLRPKEAEAANGCSPAPVEGSAPFSSASWQERTAASGPGGTVQAPAVKLLSPKGTAGARPKESEARASDGAPPPRAAKSTVTASGACAPFTQRRRLRGASFPPGASEPGVLVQVPVPASQLQPPLPPPAPSRSPGDSVRLSSTGDEEEVQLGPESNGCCEGGVGGLATEPSTLPPEIATAAPPALAAVTTHCRTLFTSSGPGVYSAANAPKIGVPLRSHWKENAGALGAPGPQPAWSLQVRLAAPEPSIRGRRERPEGAGGVTAGDGETTTAALACSRVAAELAAPTRHCSEWPWSAASTA